MNRNILPVVHDSIDECRFAMILRVSHNTESFFIAIKDFEMASYIQLESIEVFKV